MVKPAAEDVAAELRKQGLEVEVREGKENRVQFEVQHNAEVIEDILNQYDQHMHFLHVVRDE